MSIVDHPRGPRIGPGVAVGITEGVIRTQVHTFYGRVREDPVLGPIFNGAVDDWDEHLAKLCDFWSSVLLVTGRFKGSPMAAHARTPGIETEHFPRWLEIWRDTARSVCRPEAADLFIAKAEMIGESLKLGLAAGRGEIPPLTR
ncbi:group III truncated hemoglobin [Phenylobacterium sp.]|uniref:group III truncated hemoglobin n=1 Tax=Phenylobacterium sp. TaxID=1871053 RepID=UPI0028121366|nr:group III truncated hemoglobin [Phenylobacterium sp.]